MAVSTPQNKLRDRKYKGVFDHILETYNDLIGSDARLGTEYCPFKQILCQTSKVFGVIGTPRGPIR